MCAKTLWPLASSTRNMAFGSGSTTRPSISMAPSFFGISSANCRSNDGHHIVQPSAARGAADASRGTGLIPKRWEGMPERTQCAECPVYSSSIDPPTRGVELVARRDHDPFAIGTSTDAEKDRPAATDRIQDQRPL